MGFWEDKCVVVTGGRGFLGQTVVRKLKERRAGTIGIADVDRYDLRKKADIIRMVEEHKPDMVIHLDAGVGGIGANRENPGKFFYDSAIMGIQLIEQARQFEIQKFVCMETICAYPKYTPVLFKEEDLWNGYPEETNVRHTD